MRARCGPGGRIEELLPHPLLEQAWPTERRLRNTKLIGPLYQGDRCAGLSGLHAAVNAIALALARRHMLSGREAEDLLEAGFRYLECHRSLATCFSYGAVSSANMLLNDMAKIGISKLTTGSV